VDTRRKKPLGNIYAFTSDGLTQRQLRDKVEEVHLHLSPRACCNQRSEQGQGTDQGSYGVTLERQLGFIVDPPHIAVKDRRASDLFADIFHDPASVC
jgi:hypothetical protein